MCYQVHKMYFHINRAVGGGAELAGAGPGACASVTKLTPHCTTTPKPTAPMQRSAQYQL